MKGMWIAAYAAVPAIGLPANRAWPDRLASAEGQGAFKTEAPGY